MQRVNYEAVRTGRDGEKRSVNSQLPGEGNQLIHSTIIGVGARIAPGQWAEVKAAALEVSATGRARKIWFGARHYVSITRADKRLL